MEHRKERLCFKKDGLILRPVLKKLSLRPYLAYNSNNNTLNNNKRIMSTIRHDKVANDMSGRYGPIINFDDAQRTEEPIHLDRSIDGHLATYSNHRRYQVNNYGNNNIPATSHSGTILHNGINDFGNLANNSKQQQLLQQQQQQHQHPQHQQPFYDISKFQPTNCPNAKVSRFLVPYEVAQMLRLTQNNSILAKIIPSTYDAINQNRNLHNETFNNENNNNNNNNVSNPNKELVKEIRNKYAKILKPPKSLNLATSVKKTYQNNKRVIDENTKKNVQAMDTDDNSSNDDDPDINEFIVGLRIVDLQEILRRAGKVKGGNKTELKQRLQRLLKKDEGIKNIILNFHKEKTSIANTEVNSNGKNMVINKDMNTKCNEIIDNGNKQSKNTANTYRNVNNPNVNAINTNMNLMGVNGTNRNGYLTSMNNNTVAKGMTLPTHFKFRNIPFYEVLCHLGSSYLFLNHGTHTQVIIRLNSEQCKLVKSSYEASTNVFKTKILLRFCVIKPTLEQHDYIPNRMTVTINDRQCSLTSVKGDKRSTNAKQLDVTRLMKLDHNFSNKINIVFGVDCIRNYYGFTLLIAKLRTVDELCNNIKIKESDYTRLLIKKELKEENNEDDVATTSLFISLVCPLSKLRMQYPCRATTCKHLQCFDAKIFMELNKQKIEWTCPICYKECIVDDLFIDGYTKEIITELASRTDVTNVQLNRDGGWNLITDADSIEVENVVNLDDSIKILTTLSLPDIKKASYDCTVICKTESSTTNWNAQKKALNINDSNVVIDLTSDDDNDDVQCITE